MALKRRTQAEQIEMIRRLAGEGWSAARIADKLKLARGTVYAYSSEAQIPLKRAPNPYHEAQKPIHAKIIKLAREFPGMTRVAIGAAAGASAVTVHRVLKLAGLPTMRQYDADGKLIDRPLESA